jgi:hypothetical protein
MGGSSFWIRHPFPYHNGKAGWRTALKVPRILGQPHASSSARKTAAKARAIASALRALSLYWAPALQAQAAAARAGRSSGSPLSHQK